MSVLLEASGVTVVHEGRTVLGGVDLRVPAGRVLAVTGPSGAGKTSLLWALAGLRRPDAGTVVLDGEPLGDRDAAAGRGVVVVPQGNGLASVLTASENVLVALLAGSVPPAEARARALAALESVGLGQAGHQARRGGCRAASSSAWPSPAGWRRPGGCCSPTSRPARLDATNRARVVDLLRAEAARGAAVVMATHDPDAAAACDGEPAPRRRRPALAPPAALTPCGAGRPTCETPRPVAWCRR
ncbi:ABC transporter ATP-binding protein [Angustibacter aerolatus]|uniref:ABC transporter ATP-binding protein n=1 Tax=Angustibacter aerolatus TaxID=1162965 RepID=A0ABQ6JPS5_9ACTN|nr:ATP-binding cassette domain-containing protein [Angustibacter aerolatus]GMA88671.1 ABC transporter ATP-binding protein [Angustibacter aerolatus]